MGEKHILNKSQTKNKMDPEQEEMKQKMSKLRKEVEETGKIISEIKTNKVPKEEQIIIKLN